MRAEHSCFGFEAPRTDSLFFALFPDATAAQQLERIAHQQCIRHRLRGRPLAAGRFHVSLLGFGKHAGLPRSLVAEAVETAATLAMPRFEVTFDRAMSFLGRPRPLVLCGGDGVAKLIAFQRTLGDAIQTRGLGRVKTQYTPHVTLLYDERGIERHAIEPVRWTVREFVLVHSLLGRTTHIPLGRWPLRG
jgi:RNA 2',3'-cyclic 3'-phosphodiesterase